MFPCSYINNYLLLGQFYRISLYGYNTTNLTNLLNPMDQCLGDFFTFSISIATNERLFA